MACWPPEAPDTHGRPAIDAALSRVVQELSEVAPSTLGPLEAERILFVAGQARRNAHASIRALTFGGDPPRYEASGRRKPRVLIHGRAIRFEICLRPRFFLDLDGPARLRILAHELFHIGPAGNGVLAPERRHGAPDARDLDERASAIAEAWTAQHGRAAPEVLSQQGEVRLSGWRRRPPTFLLADVDDGDYTEADLYPAIVELS